MKSHRTDRVSLTFAMIFLLVAVWWLMAQALELTLPAVGWFVAGGLIFFGLLGLIGALRSARTEPAAVASAPPVTSAPPVASAPPVTSAPPAPPVWERRDDATGG